MNARVHTLDDTPTGTERLQPLPSAPCNQLPPAARDLLVIASQVPDPHERRRAIDTAIERVKARFPECFIPQE